MCELFGKLGSVDGKNGFSKLELKAVIPRHSVMPLAAKVVLTVLIVFTQMAIVIIYIKSPADSFTSYRAFHFRGEWLFPSLKKQGDLMRQNGSDCKRLAGFGVFGVVCALCAPLALIWG